VRPLRGCTLIFAARICSAKVGWLAARVQHSLLILRLAYACIWADGLASLASFGGSSARRALAYSVRLIRLPLAHGNSRADLCGYTAVEDSDCDNSVHSPEEEIRTQLLQWCASACDLGKRGHLRPGLRDRRDKAPLSDSLLTRIMHDVAKGMLLALNCGDSAWRVKPPMSTYTLNGVSRLSAGRARGQSLHA